MTGEQKDLYLGWQRSTANADLVTGFGQLAQLLADAGQGPLVQAILEERPAVLQFRESAILYRKAKDIGAQGLTDYIVNSWNRLTPEQLRAQNLARYGEADKGPTTAKAEIFMRTMNPQAGASLPEGTSDFSYRGLVRETLGSPSGLILPSR